MSLSGLVGALDGVPAYRRLLRGVERKNGRPQHASVMDAPKPFLIAALWRVLDRPSSS